MTSPLPRRDVPLDDVLAQLSAAANQPFETANPIPPAVNHSEAFFAHERRQVFMREWICAGRADAIRTAQQRKGGDT